MRGPGRMTGASERASGTLVQCFWRGIGDGKRSTVLFPIKVAVRTCKPFVAIDVVWLRKTWQPRGYVSRCKWAEEQGEWRLRSRCPGRCRHGRMDHGAPGGGRARTFSASESRDHTSRIVLRGKLERYVQGQAPRSGNLSGTNRCLHTKPFVAVIRLRINHAPFILRSRSSIE